MAAPAMGVPAPIFPLVGLVVVPQATLRLPDGCGIRWPSAEIPQERRRPWALLL